MRRQILGEDLVKTDVCAIMGWAWPGLRAASSYQGGGTEGSHK